MQNKPQTILIVEDDKFISEYIGMILVDRNYKIIQCSSGKKGYEYALKEKIDLILLDLMLPDISGIDLLKNFKADVRTISIPVIIVSSISDKNSIKTCYEIGVDDYLTKPFELSDLFSKIEKAMHKSDKISVKKISNKVCIELRESITQIEVNKIKTLINHFINQKSGNIIIDFTNVNFLDEEINMVLLSTISKLMHDKGKAYIVCPASNKNVLKKLPGFFQKEKLVFETFPQAIRA